MNQTPCSGGCGKLRSIVIKGEGSKQWLCNDCRNGRKHSWCFGGDVKLCSVCTAHMDAFDAAISAKRPFSNILRGDIRTFNEDHLPFFRVVDGSKLTRVSR